MTLDDIKRIAQMYVDKHKNDLLVGPNAIYALDMCRRLQEFTPNQTEKAHRWIGFIQGVFWTEHIYSIEQMREHNK